MKGSRQWTLPRCKSTGRRTPFCARTGSSLAPARSRVSNRRARPRFAGRFAFTIATSDLSERDWHMTRLIIDTDPGIDDALALFFALAAPDVQLEAVTSVSGNVSVDKTTRNALSLLDLAGRSDVPVARG